MGNILFISIFPVEFRNTGQSVTVAKTTIGITYEKHITEDTTNPTRQTKPTLAMINKSIIAVSRKNETLISAKYIAATAIIAETAKQCIVK